MTGVGRLGTWVFGLECRYVPSPNCIWLPAVLKQLDYHTVSVDNLADHKPWFWRGFEYYINPRKRGDFPDCHAFNERTVEWLTHTRREPFFMHLHFWDPHTPYLPKREHMLSFYQGDPTTTNVGSLDPFYDRPQVERWPKTWFGTLLEQWPDTQGPRIEDKDFICAMYDAEVLTPDDGVPEVVETLERQGILDDTLIFIFGDHGEELDGQHGIWFDHHGLYDSNIRVPMIMYWPKGLGGGRRVSAMTQHPDIAATVIDLLGKQVPEVVDGQSMLPLARGEKETSHWNHTLMTCESTWQCKWAMRTPEYKLIVSREPDYHEKPPVELYDLLADPGELTNIVNDNADLTRTLLTRFDLLLKSMLEQRGLKQDPIATHGLTLGRRMFERLGRPYPPPRNGWKGHPVPALAGARPSRAAAKA